MNSSVSAFLKRNSSRLLQMESVTSNNQPSVHVEAVNLPVNAMNSSTTLEGQQKRPYYLPFSVTCLTHLNSLFLVAGSKHEDATEHTNAYVGCDGVHCITVLSLTVILTPVSFHQPFPRPFQNPHYHLGLHSLTNAACQHHTNHNGILRSVTFLPI